MSDHIMQTPVLLFIGMAAAFMLVAGFVGIEELLSGD
jgi:hypothetical protein